ncbi:DCC1-like thiol-disulfide oxidoreductase family protein [Streptosporangium sp. NPDC000509]|uniref:thiol-disulfide oxidoreductase DCC family protein n=1 Tax=Streptosporangium sp. NPDC000509 TaxID=3366186 RepID=UPI003690AB8A
MTEEPVLVFDGDCGFCTTSVRFAKRRIGVRARVVPWQFADLRALGVTRERAEREVLWVEGGRVYGEAQAVARLLIAAGLPWSPLGFVLRIPPFRWVARGVYRLVAANRHRLPGGTPACALPSKPSNSGPASSPPTASPSTGSPTSDPTASNSTASDLADSDLTTSDPAFSDPAFSEHR